MHVSRNLTQAFSTSFTQESKGSDPILSSTVIAEHGSAYKYIRMIRLGCPQHLSSSTFPSLGCYNVPRLPSPGKASWRKLTCSVNCDQEKNFLKVNLKENLWRLLNAVPDWADEVKESGMKQRRALYTHDDWLKHRSSKRHIRHWISSLSSRVILSLVPPVCIFTLIAAVIAAYNTAVLSGVLPSFMPLLHASSLPSELTAPALALLLVFRTEASYSRYDEGRKTWTKVIGRTKDFARQANSWIRHPCDAPLRSSLLSYIMAFPVALKGHIIHGSDVEHDLGRLLSDEDLTVVLTSEHRPNCLIQFLSAAIQQLHLGDSKIQVLDSHISQFNESVSVCERLIRSPIPLSYTRLTSRFLVFWHLTLPVILWDDCQWMVIPAAFFSASSLFCVEEVGVLIEEPFPMLALDKMCALVHENILEMVEFQGLIEDHLRHKVEKDADKYPVATNGRAMEFN